MISAREYDRRARAASAFCEVPPWGGTGDRPAYGGLAFDGLWNVRDLGGLPASGGKRVRRGVLLRSCALGMGTESDIRRLRSEYALSLVVDLRCDQEVTELPDPVGDLLGVRYVRADILAKRVAGIAQDRESRKHVDLWSRSDNSDPADMMAELYPHLLLDPPGIVGYRAFFQALLACEKGAALWHCSAGRDRCGMASVLIEYALGVSERDIEADYLATNAYVPRELIERGAASTRSLHAAVDAVRCEYGGFEGYLVGALGLSARDIESLRERYLT